MTTRSTGFIPVLVLGAVLLCLALIAPAAAKTNPVVENVDESWVLPTSLLQELELLRESPYTASWAESTIQVIKSLEKLDGIGDPDCEVVFQHLHQQLEKLDFIVKQLIDASSKPQRARDNLVSILRQTRYSIERRLAIWPAIHEVAKSEAIQLAQLDDQRVGRFLLASKSKLETSSMEQGWAEYLKLDEAARTFNSLNSKELAKRKAARDVLGRAFNPALSLSQKKYLSKAIDGQTLEILKVSSVGPFDMHDFLKRIEKFESRNSGASQFHVNDYYQSALWSDHPELQQLAAELQTHYRNANFRVSIHEILLNRMLPPLPDTQEPYRDEIHGAQVRGQTRISNRLNIGLIPDPNQISMRLETNGNVKSRTFATRSGVVVENEGDSRFRIIKRLALGQNGIFAYRPETTSQTRQRIVGLRSNVDNIPPLGWVVRKIARNKIEQAAPITNRYTQHKLEVEAEKRFETEVQSFLTELETLLTERLLHPLVAMDLEPDPVEISTGEKQIVLRYRLGGRDQMAANTARPKEMPGSLMSMQIHESAVNNVIRRFEFGGKKFTTAELVEYINRMFQTHFVSEDQDKPANFEFAHFDPVRIDFDNGKVSISLSLRSLKVGKGKTWKRLNIKATYDAQIENGFQVRLIQSEENGLRLTGSRLRPRDQIAIRLICEMLFPSEFSVKLMPEHLGGQLSVNSLQATQFVLSGGWLGISVADHARMANRQNSEEPRQTLRILDRWRQ